MAVVLSVPVLSLAALGNYACRITGSDSESECSSSEGSRQMFAFSGRSGPTAGHKKTRKKKSIPVAPPKLPSFESSLFTHTSSNNGQSSPSSSSFSKLLNVHPDGSGKLPDPLPHSLTLPLSHFLSLNFGISSSSLCRLHQDRLLSLTRSVPMRRSLMVISGAERVTFRCIRVERDAG